ncbi:MAG: hypothetical protein WCO19_03270 [Candidatus Saccharibacteria bacterium]
MNNHDHIQNLTKRAKEVAEVYAKLEHVCSVVIAGSLARGFSDKNSDIELYVYYDMQMPTEKEILNILQELPAKLTRSNDVHWHHKAWGYHTFFEYWGTKFELGYRDIHEINVRLKNFQSGLILPQHGIHDTPFGHYESGLASCVEDCVILYDRNNDLNRLKEFNTAQGKTWILDEIFDYYVSDALTILEVKALPAAERNDTFNYNACLARSVRSILIALFALNDTYFPGDKWNEKYLKRFKVIPKEFKKRINKIMHVDSTTRGAKMQTIHDFILIAKEVEALKQA